MAIAKLKTFIDTSLKSVSAPLDRTATLEPEIGIRIVHSLNNKTLQVTVLGARHLPQNFGLTRVNSYVVKIKLLPKLTPGNEKFETTTKNESWPQWNEDFVFHLEKEIKGKFGKKKVVEEEVNGSRFIVASLYAILEDKPLIATEKKEGDKDKKSDDKKDSKKKDTAKDVATSSPKQEPLNKRFSFFSKSTDKVSDSSPERSKIFDKRKLIGSTTITLDKRNFSVKLPKSKHSSDVSTGDMWRQLKPISSGIAGSDERRENKKGQVELSLCQEKSDKKDVSSGNLVLTLLRLRCSLQNMHEHENLKGQMYIKMSVVEGGRVTYFWKSDRFAPCVSMKFAPEQAKVIAENSYEGALKDVSFVIKFVSKNKLGKKVTVGHFVLGPEVGGSYGEQWKQALSKPGQQIVKWQHFE